MRLLLCVVYLCSLLLVVARDAVFLEASLCPEKENLKKAVETQMARADLRL